MNKDKKNVPNASEFSKEQIDILRKLGQSYGVDDPDFVVGLSTVYTSLAKSLHFIDELIKANKADIQDNDLLENLLMSTKLELFDYLQLALDQLNPPFTDLVDKVFNQSSIEASESPKKLR